jgi:hydroxycarboxylate dehydrogenase B
VTDPEVTIDRLRPFLLELFRTYGTPVSNAAVVVEHLLDSSACGLPSHGVLRVPDYLDAIESGAVDPTAEPRTASDGAVLVLDAQHAFGPVAAAHAVRAVSARAREHGAGVVALRQAGHLGRIGAYVETIARDGFLGIGFCAVPTRFHNVAWFGAREGRLGTNPIAYAFPTQDEPVVADFSTSATPEGRIRLLRNQGALAPEGLLRDARGRPTSDPNVLYQDPPGALQPLGGTEFGHKGSALGLLAEVMGTVLAGEEIDDPNRNNNLTLVALTPDDGFRARAGRAVDYLHAATPIDDGVPPVVPGELEAGARKRCESIVVDAVSWTAILERADRKGVRHP